MATSIDNTPATNTVANLSAPKSGALSTQKTTPQENTTQTTTPQTLKDDVQVSEQGKALSYARMNPGDGNSGDKLKTSSKAPFATAAANQQKNGEKLAEQALSNNVSDQERASLNEGLMAVNSSPEGMGQGQVQKTVNTNTATGAMTGQTNQAKQAIDTLKNFAENTGEKSKISIVV